MTKLFMRLNKLMVAMGTELFMTLKMQKVGRFYVTAISFFLRGMNLHRKFRSDCIIKLVFYKINKIDAYASIKLY